MYDNGLDKTLDVNSFFFFFFDPLCVLDKLVVEMGSFFNGLALYFVLFVFIFCVYVNRYTSPDLEHHFEQVPGSIPLSGIRFHSKRGQDFFARMCKGVCLMYRMFQEDLIYLVASEVLSFGIEGLQEFGGQNQFEMVLRKCFEVAEQINKDDPNWISKQREVEQVFTIRALMSSHGGYNRQPSTQEAQAATESNARRRRRRRSKRQSAQQPTEH